jgi:hypothetical protein
MTSLEYPKNSGHLYTCEHVAGNVVCVTAKVGVITWKITTIAPRAISWLCDRSLKRSKATQLVESCLAPDETISI